MNAIDFSSRDEIQRRAEALGPWFHNIDLNGAWTAPNHFLGNYPAVKWRGFADAIPQDLTGKTVLDIGCNAGFYSFEMRRRGASRVLGIDSDARYLAQARLAAEVLDMDGVEFRQMGVYDVAALGERFDLVIFMGVLYHLRHPLLALDLIRAHVAGDTMLFQTLTRGPGTVAEPAEDYDFSEDAHFQQPDWPRMAFIERKWAHDWTNWWVPNEAASAGMLRAAGFEILEHPEPEVFLCRRGPAPKSGAVYPAKGSAA